jgi:C4-dicarboxylate transporter, DctM subunit
MSPATVGVIGVVVLIIFFLLRVPVAFTMALVGLVGLVIVGSPEAAYALLSRDFWGTFSNYNLSVLPMFVFMGSIAFYSGISGRLYNVAYKFVGQFRGGLALATVFACALFGAMCASTIAAAAAMGKVTIPEMDKYGYDKSLSTGCVAAAGTLAILIPPSGILIIYGILIEESIGKLFAAGIIPGILLTILLALAVFILVRVKPGMAPAGQKTTWTERFKSLGGVTEMIILFAFVMGGLFLGWFTPTEAGAAGAAGALLIALARRSLTWKGLLSALDETARLTAMVYLIIAAATIFGKFMSLSQIPAALAQWVNALPLPPAAIIGMIIVGYLIGGCFMDSLPMITLTVPILYPVILDLGFSSIWFGIIIVLVVEMGAITPPVGINVFTIKGIAPDVPLGTIFKGIFPFLGAIVVCTTLLIIFPQIVLFLPQFITY